MTRCPRPGPFDRAWRGSPSSHPCSGLASLAGAAPVGAVDAITLTTPYPGIAVAPGATPSFDISVKTATPGRVDLSVGKVPDGWTALLHGGGYTIDSVESPGGTQETKITLNVTVPADAAGGTQRIDVKGTTAGGASATLTVELRVSPNAAGEVTLATDVAHLQGASNVSFSFTLTLTNGTPEDLPFSATATGPAGWTVTAQMGSQAQAASTVVKAGQNETVAVTAKAASDAAAGDYPIAVDVDEREPVGAPGSRGHDHRQLQPHAVDQRPAAQHERHGRVDHRPDARGRQQRHGRRRPRRR